MLTRMQRSLRNISLTLSGKRRCESFESEVSDDTTLISLIYTNQTPHVTCMVGKNTVEQNDKIERDACLRFCRQKLKYER